MSRGGRYWVWWLGEAFFALGLVAVFAPRWEEAAVSAPTAIVAGLATAGLLFVALVRPRRAGAVPRGRRRLVSAKAAVLILQSLVEEVLWRLVVLIVLAQTLGWPVGLVASTVGFALVHARLGRRAVLVHHVTGLAFGAVFLATGRFLAPAVAHGAYNALVLLATERRRPVGKGR